MLYSPYREVIRPIVEYAIEIREANPRGVVAVYIPEYVVGRWWEQLLHNQTALRLKGRLLFTPGVMVTSVPYQLRGSEVAKERDDWELDSGASGRRAPRPHPVGSVTEAPGLAGRSTASSSRSARSPTAVTSSARHEGQVVFVRHALPGERVTVEVTEDDGRVPARRRRGGARGRRRTGCPRPARTPARAGAAGATSSTWRSTSSGGSRRRWSPSSCPGSRGCRGTSWSRRCLPPDGLAWRTRMQYVHLPDGRRGLRKHRSHDVVPIDRCLIAHPDAREPEEGAVRETVDTSAGAPRLRGRGRRVLAAARVRAAHPGRVRARPRSTPGGGVGCSTSTPGSGCSAAFLAERVGLDRVGRRRRGRPRRVAALAGQPRGVPLARSSPAGSTGSCTAASARARPRRARPAAGRGEAPGRPRRSRRSSRGPWRTSPATRPPSPATSATSPSTATG